MMPNGPKRRNNIGEKPKLKNAKGTIKRLIEYLGKRKILIILVLFFCLATTIVSIFATQISSKIVDNFFPVIVDTGVLENENYKKNEDDGVIEGVYYCNSEKFITIKKNDNKYYASITSNGITYNENEISIDGNEISFCESNYQAFTAEMNNENIIIKNITVQYITSDTIRNLLSVCVILLFMYLLSSICTFIQNRMMVNVSQKTSAIIRNDLFNSLQRLPLKYYDSHSSGDIMSRLTNDVDNINLMFSQTITQLFSGLINILGYFVAMLILSPALTIVGILVTMVTIPIMNGILRKTRPLFVHQQRVLGNLNGYIEEMISGQKAVFIFNEEDNVINNFQVINKDFTKTATKAQVLSSIMGPIHNFVSNFNYLIIIVVGALFSIYVPIWKDSSNLTFLNILFPTTVSAGLIYAFVLYLKNFNRPINEIFQLMNTLQTALAGAERVFEIIDEKPEKDLDTAKDKYDYYGDVLLDNVDFSYDKEKRILKNITIKANKGDTIAIVGHTGAGKTTIINLLTKFYDIDSGNITFDGENIDNITRKSLRRKIGLVLQDTFLFNASIKENIGYGHLKASDEEIINAARMANAHNFIMQLPDGYDTVLSDNGSNLSQGQRQLLAIARAILSDSAILILDEATSSIDTKTEIEIQKALLKLMEGKTCFVIAHRLSTIKNATKIIVIDDGRVIEEGTHDELISKKGFYASLYNSQFENQIVKA